MEVLADEQVRPEAWVWVHAQNGWELESRVETARKGAWIEIDNIGEQNVAECAARAHALKQRGCLNRLLVSHDAGWYRPGEPRGGAFRGFETVYTALVPALEQAGWTRADLDQLLLKNPASAFTIRVRARL
jgi:phosphotriesterase-related protein